MIEALAGAVAMYHVRRDLSLSSDETKALLQALGVFEDLRGGGHVSIDRAKSVAREHIPPDGQLEPVGGEDRD